MPVWKTISWVTLSETVLLKPIQKHHRSTCTCSVLLPLTRSFSAVDTPSTRSCCALAALTEGSPQITLREVVDVCPRAGSFVRTTLSCLFAQATSLDCLQPIAYARRRWCPRLPGGSSSHSRRLRSSAPLRLPWPSRPWSVHACERHCNAKAYAGSEEEPSVGRRSRRPVYDKAYR